MILATILRMMRVMRKTRGMIIELFHMLVMNKICEKECGPTKVLLIIMFSKSDRKNPSRIIRVYIGVCLC